MIDELIMTVAIHNLDEIGGVFEQIAKALFALGFEILADGGSQGLFNAVVEVHKRQSEPVGQLSAHGGFP